MPIRSFAARRRAPRAGRDLPAGWVVPVLTLLLGLTAAPSASWAEDDGDRQRAEAWQRIFRGHAVVDLVEVEVRVTDREGDPVHGLGRDDFEVLVGGRSVPVENFFAAEGRPSEAGAGVVSEYGKSETAAAPETDVPPGAGDQDEAGTAGPEEERPLVVVYVDHATLGEQDRARVLPELREFLAGIEPRPRAMLVTNDRSLVVRQPVTTSTDEMLDALANLESGGALRTRFESDRRDLLVDLERVDVVQGSGAFATKMIGGEDQTNAAVEQSQGRTPERMEERAKSAAGSILQRLRLYSRERTSHTLAQLEVLEQLVRSIGGLPGRKTVLVLTGGLPLRPAEALFEAFSRRFEALGDVSADLHVVAESSRDDASERLDAVLETANLRDVSFYVLDAARDRSRETGSAATAHRLAGNFASWDDNVASMEQEDARAGLRRMARETGGLFGPTPASWDGVLGGLRRDWAHYYSLGIAAEHVPEGSVEDLEVRLSPGAAAAADDPEILHRRSIGRSSPRTRVAEATRAALLREVVDNPLGLGAAADLESRLDNGNYLVPVSVRIPLDRLVLLPGDSELAGRVSMFVAVRDPEGRTSDVAEHVCPIRIPHDDVLTALGQSAICGLRLEMRPGPQRVALTVLDEVAAVGSTVFLSLDVGADDRLDAGR